MVPEFLEQLSLQPSATLAEYDLDASTVDLLCSTDFRKLRCFTGFITKVQNKDLLSIFPHTISLLHERGLQLEAFARYCRVHQENRSRTQRSLRHRIDGFVAVLESFLETLPRASRNGIRELYIHERNIWEIKCELANGAANASQQCLQPSLARKDFVSLVPTINGPLRITRFHVNPLSFVNGASGRPQSSNRVTSLAYWGDVTTNCTRIFVVDSRTALILAHIDGSQSVGRIFDSLKQGFNYRGSLRGFRFVLDRFCHSGLLLLRC
jgi:hypothetical protein